MRRFKNFIFGVLLLFGYCNFGFVISNVHAVSDPQSVPNNKIGVHILDTSELSEAVKLVNSSGGDWGYVTIPIRSDDRDLEKWTKFFENTKSLHLIPIVRLVTYVDNDSWVEPTPYDLVDFANFLSQLPWPITNRYVILFNEPNHSNEWGRELSPDIYARLLVDANGIFKARSTDFYLISAGLDMSAPNSNTSMDALEFYRQMSIKVPDWYAQIDGLSVHAYPNPAFSASPYSTTRFGITSYQYEQKYLARFGFTGKPLFISETGTKNKLGFYKPAITEIWTDQNIVAITPFLLFAGAGPFYEFSLLDINRKPTQNYQDIQTIPKIKGSPLLSSEIPPVTQTFGNPLTNLPLQNSSPTVWNKLARIFSFKKPYLSLDKQLISVEISDTDAKRAQGLSGRPPLAENRGMLFTFPYKMPMTFWMNDMRFALDFIWLADGKVVELNADIPPPDKTGGTPVVIRPANFADKVLEINAGYISAHHIQVGDSANLVWQ